MNDDPKNEGFWGPLGGYTDPATLPAGDSDADVVVKKVTKLFQLGAEADADLVSEGPLSKSMLKSTEVYLLHSTDKLYVWVGKDAELETKRRATQAAVDYIKKVRREEKKEGRYDVIEDAMMKMDFCTLLSPLFSSPSLLP
jgi:Gelsolin repeat